MIKLEFTIDTNDKGQMLFAMQPTTEVSKAPEHEQQFMSTLSDSLRMTLALLAPVFGGKVIENLGGQAAAEAQKKFKSATDTDEQSGAF